MTQVTSQVCGLAVLGGGSVLAGLLPLCLQGRCQVDQIISSCTDNTGRLNLPQPPVHHATLDAPGGHHELLAVVPGLLRGRGHPGHLLHAHDARGSGASQW